MTRESGLLIPDWPAAPSVRACSTTRSGGVSPVPFDSFNLGLHVGDANQSVENNRARLMTLAALPAEPLWLEQVHGTGVIHADNWHPGIEADAVYADKADQVCAIMTADCLPVLFTNRKGTAVAAAHAGWRGLLNGVIENTLGHFHQDGGEILAWLGPAIGPTQFEVGTEVFAAFTDKDSEAATAFTPTDQAHYLADIYLLARQRLAACGVTAVFGGDNCTFSDKARFFSYRRDGVTGRMASLIWISDK